MAPPNGTVGQRHENSTATTGTTTTPGATAQQAWLRLFEHPQQHKHQHHNQDKPPILDPRAHQFHDVPPSLDTPGASFPLVGGDYDFVETQSWPSDIVHIARNVFSASQPYPISKRHSSYHYHCECDVGRCIADNGTRASSSCINVNQDIVCDDTNCLVGPNCGNRMQQQYQLDLISTRVGLGVVCDTSIPKDAFIIEYVGEVLLDSDARNRADRSYMVELRSKASWDGPRGLYIDAARCGNESRFINHSCNPNCSLFELEWANTSRLGIFAKHDIPPLRELTFRYRDSKLSMFTCQCGHKNCISK